MPRRTGPKSGFRELADELRRDLELRGSGSEDDFADENVRDVVRLRAEVELADLDDIEELYQSLGIGARASEVRNAVVERLCDLDTYPAELFRMMCKMREERDRRLLAELRVATDLSRFPAWIQARMADPLRRAEFLTHLEYGIPFWQLEAALERESRAAIRLKEARVAEMMGGEAARGMRGGPPRYGDD